jgi:hypothetical protein
MVLGVSIYFFVTRFSALAFIDAAWLDIYSKD